MKIAIMLGIIILTVSGLKEKGIQVQTAIMVSCSILAVGIMEIIDLLKDIKKNLEDKK
jgi:hypothetical protein